MTQPSLGSRYAIIVGRRVRKFLKRHQDLNEKWYDISEALAQFPFAGPQVTHLKGQLLCSRRWRADPYRILYDIDKAKGVVRAFDADVRGDIY